MAQDAVTPILPSRPGELGPAGTEGPAEARPRLALAQYAGFLPALVLYGLFFLVPLGLIVAYSFWKVVDYNVVHDWTIDNYRYFFSVPTYVKTMWATLWVALLSTALTLGIAFPFAYWLARYVPKRMQRVLLVLVILPFWTSYLLRVYSWLNILGAQGALNRFLEWSGITGHPVSFFLYDRPAVVLVLVYLYFPFAALTLYASLERFDWDQFKAAMDLGAKPATAIRRIMLPQIKPGITTSVIFVFIPILGEYLAPQLVGGARGVMIGNLIVNFFQGGQYTRGAAAALLIAALIVVLLVVLRRSLEVKDAYGA
ncbi:MAG: spermidine/putrescine transport system permease protein [Gaiellaceae bacterium]|nr:spermidine/putrescine transport system permease protein [Gaiellaceae bacterium]